RRHRERRRLRVARVRLGRLATPDGAGEHLRVRGGRRRALPPGVRGAAMSGFLEGIGYSGWIIQFLLLFPVVGMAVVLLGGERTAKQAALAITTIELIVSLPLWFAFNAASASFQFAATAPWIPEWGIYYRVGMDGMSLLLVLLTTFITPLTIL